jgi:aryl-alcohol dehydrogenase-like predicted oxidoreductase
VIPIIGARTLAQLEDNLGALDVELADEQVARLDAASRIELGFPQDFGGGSLAYGEPTS